MRSLLKITCIIGCFLACTTTTNAQLYNVDFIRNNTPTFASFLVPHFNPFFGLGYVYPNKSLDEVAEGSQFYNEEFKSAKVATVKKDFKARYNAFFDEMEVQNGKTNGWLNKAIFIGQSITTEDDKTYKILDANKDIKELDLGYYEVLLDNKNVSLYKKNNKKISVGMEKSQYMTPAPEVIIEYAPKRTDFYVEFKNDGNANKLSRTRRGVSKLFGDKREVVLTYIKKNKLDVTEEEDIKKVIEYINTL
jgi:hypothetical protein